MKRTLKLFKRTVEDAVEVHDLTIMMMKYNNLKDNINVLDIA